MRSDGGVLGDFGSNRGRGVAHWVCRDVLKLEVVIAGTGAHGRVGNLLPELLLAMGALGRYRGQRYEPQEDKQKVSLDAQEIGECESVNERGRRGQKVLRELVGEETDSGAARLKT